MTLPTEAAAGRLRIVQIGAWQLGATILLVTASGTTGRGSPASIVAGSLLLFVSLVLQQKAVALALGTIRRPALATALFLLKLALLLAVAAIGLRTTLLAPMSFAVGASTLLLAIVLDTCYGARSASRHS